MDQLRSLKAYGSARELSRAAYVLTMSGPLARHWGLADQIRRSAASVPANIAEGYALGTRRQLIRALRIALGSACELKEHLELARDLGLVEQEQARDVLSTCQFNTRLLVGLLKRLRARVPGEGKGKREKGKVLRSHQPAAERT